MIEPKLTCDNCIHYAVCKMYGNYILHYDTTGRICGYFKEEQPTTYNMDKVVERLEEEMKLANIERERCARENQLQFEQTKGYANGIYNAIEIVKAGGADE